MKPAPTDNEPDARKRRWWRRLRLLSLLVLALVVLGSCSHLGYYSQSLAGGASVLAKRRPVETVIADPETDDTLRGQLEAALEMRRFASDELLLPDNDSYMKYSDLERPYALWNVVAAPELSIEPHTWCFLIVGCVAYRGYFSEERAEKFADKMRRRGYDVDVGGVAAYSTAGWFADPLLSTFIHRPEPYLAGLIFHELAHQKVLVKGDTTFNESLAMAIEEEGALRWLAAAGRHDEIESYRLLKRRERQFSDLVFDYRDRLAQIYTAAENDDWKRERKAETFADLLAAYDELKQTWGGYSGYDGWFDRGVNNARLALIGVYHEWVPAFQALLTQQNGSLADFYAEVEALAALEPAERHRRMEALLSEAEPGPVVEDSPVVEEDPVVKESP